MVPGSIHIWTEKRGRKELIIYFAQLAQTVQVKVRMNGESLVAKEDVKEATERENDLNVNSDY